MSKPSTPMFRVAFPHVFKTKYNKLNKKDEYGLVALFETGQDLKVLKVAAQEALAKKFGQDKTQWPENLKSPFRDQGDRETKNKTTGKMEMPQGYVKGAVYLNLRSEQRPGVVDHNVVDIIDSGDFYGGCYAIASVNAYAYDQGGNVGVAFGLGNIQKIKDGDAFGNRTKPQDDFKPVQQPASENNASAGGATSLFD